MTDEETTTEPIQQALDSFLVDLLGWMPEVTHRWAGIFGLTQDLLPLVGPLPTRRDVGRRRLLRPRQRPRVHVGRAGGERNPRRRGSSARAVLSGPAARLAWLTTGSSGRAGRTRAGRPASARTVKPGDSSLASR